MENNEKYEIIFKSASGKEPAVGDVKKVRTGDIVTYYDNGFRTTTVEKVLGNFAKRVKVKAIMYGNKIVRRGKVVQLSEIKEVLRPIS